MVDFAEMAAVAAQHPISTADARFGEAGVSKTTLLLELVTDVYRARAYELMPGGCVAFTIVEDMGEAIPEGGKVIASLDELALAQPAAVTLCLHDAGAIEMWADARDDVPFSGTVVYSLRQGTESVFIDGEERKLPTFGFPSVLVAPTFVDLDASIDHYAIHLVRLSQCPTLSTKWRDANRLLFLPKPEATMRKSLAVFLKGSLRDHKYVEVREEQPVDDSYPVDLKVTWNLSNRIALIELKWLGKSADEHGNHITTEYTAARGNEGVKQMVDYLDRNRPQAVLLSTRGYVVIYDARRRGVTVGTKTLSTADGLHYAAEDIVYDAELLTRPDLAPPKRMFIEPVCG